MKSDRLSPNRQVLPILFLSLAADAVVRPFVSPDGIRAQSAVWGLLIGASALCALAAAFCFAVSESSLRLMRSGRLPQAKAVLILFSAATALSGGASLVTSERFYRYVSDEPTLSLVTAALILAAAAYAVSRGIPSVARTAGVVCALFVAGAGLLVVSSLSSARLENLPYSKQIFEDAARWLAKSRALPAEILCFLMMKLPTAKHRGTASLRRAFIASAAFYAGILILEELVLGTRAGAQLQPAHTLARLGGISVFKRFDALHVGIWLLALLVRQSLFLFGTRSALEGILPSRAAKFVLPLSLALTLAGAFASAAIPQSALAAVLSIATAAALSAALAFSYCVEGTR